MIGKTMWGDSQDGMCQICEFDSANHTMNTPDGLCRVCDACYEREMGLRKIERLNDERMLEV